jgi:hypothetical protein
VHDGAQGAVVQSNSTHRRDMGGPTPAPGAGCGFQAVHAPGWKRIAAVAAERRGEREDGRPASGADRPLRRMRQRSAARGAHRGDENGNQAVGERLQRRPEPMRAWRRRGARR